jgi:hypothetical protein
VKLIECPHCLARVLPMTNHGCPACQKDTRAASTSPFTRITVTPNTVFPDRCCACADPTTKRVAIVGKGHGADPLWVRIFAGAAMVLKPSLLIENKDALAGDPELFRVAVPYCKACAKKSRLHPEYVNTKQGTVELKVMRIFADETSALNAQV